MKDPKQTYNQTKHLSQDQLLRYQEDRMSGAEMQQVERHLLSCALCSDALEGISLLEPAQAKAGVEDIKSRLAQRLAEEKAVPAADAYWKRAAAAAVLLLIAAAGFMLLIPAEVPEQGLAHKEITEQEIALQAEPAITEEVTGPPPINISHRVVPEKSIEQISAAEAPAPMLALEEKQTKADMPYKSPAAPATAAEIVAEPEKKNTETAAKTAIPLSSEIEVAATAPEKKEAAELARTMETERAARARIADMGLSYQTTAPAAATSKTKEGNRQISGVVTDAETGEPLPGVIVKVAGSTKGVVTDMQGEYTLTLPAAETSLSFNFIGYREKSMPINDKTGRITATLEPEVESLSEVVITTRGAESRRALRGKPSSAVNFSVAARPAEGLKQFNRYLRKNTSYPAAAAEAGVAGDVVVEFFVETDGSLSQFEVIHSLGYGLDEEAIRLIKEGPRWEPAVSKGNTVREKARVTVPFKLSDR